MRVSSYLRSSSYLINHFLNVRADKFKLALSLAQLSPSLYFLTISRTLYTFTFLVKFSHVNYFCIKCKYHISRILLKILTKRAQITPQILLTTKNTVFTLKILLLASKPTGHLVPRCRNNFQLWRQEDNSQSGSSYSHDQEKEENKVT